MSGHSKWATIKRQKGANDAKRGAVFTKIGNQIAIAARSGTDPAMNPALAMMIEKARAVNMPTANIQRAIARVADKSAAQMEEVTYEGYGPGGIAIIVEAATDNKNRTYPEIRNIFSKTGGNIAEPGSVAFQFTRKGVIRVRAQGEDALLEVLDAGAQDAVEEGDEIVVYTDMKDLARVRDKLLSDNMELSGAELAYVPNNTVEITETETARKIVRIMDALDEHDDVVNTYSNFDIDDTIASQL